MAYTFTNVSNTVLSVHPFGPGFLKPGESFELELEDLNTHIAKLVAAGFLSVTPALPQNFFPMTDNQMLNAVNDIFLGFLTNLGAYTFIKSSLIPGTTPKQYNLEIFVGIAVRGYNSTGTIQDIEDIAIPAGKFGSCTLQVIPGSGSATISFDNSNPKFGYVVKTANRDKFKTEAFLFNFDKSQSLLAGILPPTIFEYKATAKATVSGTSGDTADIKAVVTGLGFKKITLQA
jgi:hypothetical protein